MVVIVSPNTSVVYLNPVTMTQLGIERVSGVLASTSSDPDGEEVDGACLFSMAFPAIVFKSPEIDKLYKERDCIPVVAKLNRANNQVQLIPWG